MRKKVHHVLQMWNVQTFSYTAMTYLKEMIPNLQNTIYSKNPNKQLKWCSSSQK